MKNHSFLFTGLFVLILLFFSSEGRAEILTKILGSTGQLVENVHYTVDNGSVIINYDLLGIPNKKYKITVELRKGSDSAFSYVPRILTGDVGIGMFAGRNRQIVWALDQEFPDGLPGKDYYFVVHAVEINNNSKFLTWLGVGAAAVVATATYIIVSKKSYTQSPFSQNVSFPPPPGRPK